MRKILFGVVGNYCVVLINFNFFDYSSLNIKVIYISISATRNIIGWLVVNSLTISLIVEHCVE